MKTYKLVYLAVCGLLLAACTDGARIKGTIADAPGKDIVVKQLNLNVYNVLDTVKTSGDGSFSYKLKLAEGQPEFVYLFYGDTRVAALLLEKGETAVVSADTLGNYSVCGSEGSSKLHEIETAYSGFIKEMASTEDPSALGKSYVKHYRESVKYVLQNPFSLTVVPVLFESINNLQVFSQATDAILFRSAADSLKKVYPESRYVKALEAEATRRESNLKLDAMLRSSSQKSFPDIVAPDINGKKVSLDSLDAKVILLHFWDASNAAQKMINLEILKPLYEEFHSQGLEIFSVCLSMDKVEWAGVVKAQRLPWINVNDGLGASSPAVSLYNISATPASLIIAGGELNLQAPSGKEGLRGFIRSMLK